MEFLRHALQALWARSQLREATLLDADEPLDSSREKVRCIRCLSADPTSTA